MSRTCLLAIAEAEREALGASQGPRNVDVQFNVEREDLKPVIKALHGAFVEGSRRAYPRVA